MAEASLYWQMLSLSLHNRVVPADILIQHAAVRSKIELLNAASLRAQERRKRATQNATGATSTSRATSARDDIEAPLHVRLWSACACAARRRGNVFDTHGKRCPAAKLLRKCANCGARSHSADQCNVLACAYCRQHGHVEAHCKRKARHRRRAAQEVAMSTKSGAEESRD